jgi:hypothetical protein
MLGYIDWLLDEHLEKLVHVHLPGYQPGYKVHRPQYCSRKMVFQVFDRLADAEFDGLIVSETLNKYQNDEELRMDVLLQKRWANKYADRRTLQNEVDTQSEQQLAVAP